MNHIDMEQFKNSSFCGYGTLSIENGIKYEGEFNDGLFHGKGRLIDYHGTQVISGYDESFEYGHFEVDNETIYEGEFKNGKFHGKGKLTYLGGGYEGEFENGRYHGIGKLTEPPSDLYSGEFKNGKYHGQGELVDVIFGVYTGHFNDGKFNGVGTFKYNNNASFFGLFFNGEFKTGILKLPNGVTYSGTAKRCPYPGYESETYLSFTLSDGKEYEIIFNEEGSNRSHYGPIDLSEIDFSL